MYVKTFWAIILNFTLAHFMFLTSVHMFIWQTITNKLCKNSCHKNALVIVTVEHDEFSAKPYAYACICVFHIIWTYVYVHLHVRACIQVYVNVLSCWVLGQDREMDAPDWGCVSFLSPVRRPAGFWPSEERENTPRWAASTGRAPRRNGSLALAPTGQYTPLTPGKHRTELYWPDQTHILNPVWNNCKHDDSGMTMCFERKKQKKTKHESWAKVEKRTESMGMKSKHWLTQLKSGEAKSYMSEIWKASTHLHELSI